VLPFLKNPNSNTKYWSTWKQSKEIQVFNLQEWKIKKNKQIPIRKLVCRIIIDLSGKKRLFIYYIILFIYYFYTCYERLQQGQLIFPMNQLNSQSERYHCEMIQDSLIWRHEWYAQDLQLIWTITHHHNKI